jgi:olfactory receptor
MIVSSHFVAICYPLHYTVIINNQFCGRLVSWSQVPEFLVTELHGVAAVLCTDVEAQDVFCELYQLAYPAFSGTFINNMVMNFAVTMLGGGPLTGTLCSYCICSISSAQGKYKEFSTSFF